MCELSAKEKKVVHNLATAGDGDNGKTIKWDAALKRFVFTDFEELGNYVTADADQDLYGTKTIYGYWAFQTDNWPTIAGQEIATTDYAQSLFSSAVSIANVGQTIDGDKQFIRRPKTSNGLGGYENLVATSDLATYVTGSSLAITLASYVTSSAMIAALSSYVTSASLTSTLSSYALKSGNLSQFASTTSAQLAALISDETGSGALVFASAPTITSPLFQGTYGFRIAGTTSGRIQFEVPAVAGSTTLTFQAVTDTVAVLGTAQTWTATQTFAAITASTITAGTSLITDVLVCNAGVGGLELRFKSGTGGVGVNITNANNSNNVGNPTGATFNLLDMTSTTFNPAAGSKNFRGINLSYTINASGAQTSNNLTGIYLNATETTLNGISHDLINVGTGGGSFVSRFKVTNGGVLTTSSSIYAGNGRFYSYNSNVNIDLDSNNNVALYGNGSRNSFGMLQFGGTTSSFPAIKRNATAIEIKLADDSAFAPITFGVPKFAGTNSTGSRTPSLGSNSPAGTDTPYTWIQALSSDGSTVYIPCWK